ncbi:fungal-specific transcription factor domain-containing protein [Fusarium redolens]|uniref:Fungal-specific transcription factor domain-containing protein n=1 Tax=Fusarium redolens TaxID=48865 RepID=A0A9P9JS30_FUSRE|nr:fungal-specific transcription factor domain-containing protein [Fusarium redolens]KAH7234853.1 fungal-specific transcription factor domain-containing protein [Fusarium redolens]
MNRSCASCATSKVRCDLDKKGLPCSRCQQKNLSCVQAGRKKRMRKTTSSSISSNPSPEVITQQNEQQLPLDQNVGWPFFDTSSFGEIDFLSQLVDIESMVDMSNWTWSPSDMTSTIGDNTLPDNNDPWTGARTNDGFICPDNFRLPADFLLELDGPETIPVHRLETLARLFFSHFHPSLPLLHIPTFCLASSPSFLIRAICFIGAGFDKDPTSTAEAKLLYGSLPSQLAKSCLRSNGSSPNFQELQALVLLQFAAMANGGSAERAASRLIHPLLVAAIRHEGLLKVHGECTKATRNAYFWTSWIQKESNKRVLWGVYAVDCYQSILCGSKPILSPTDTRASFPCDDASWTACSASLWASLPAQDPSSCFLTSVKGLMVGHAPAETNLTDFGMNLLILAVNSLLVEAQTSILPVDTSALDLALQTWYASWQQYQAQPRSLCARTATSILITNSLSLYRLGVHFIRNGRPVLDEKAYLERSTDTRNPLIIKEQVYQDEMMKYVRRVLNVFEEA